MAKNPTDLAAGESDGKAASALAFLALPLRIKETGESSVIRDAAETLILAVYFDGDDEVRRQVSRRVGRGEAKAIAQVAARAITAAREG